MSENLEHIGVNVWMCGTIYVEASSQDEAARIVAERYAGTFDKPDTYDHMDGEDLPLDGDDFQSSAVTLYGLASRADLVPVNDPVRKAASDMLAILKEIQALPGAAVDIERAGLGDRLRTVIAEAEASR
jgi:hypothetical protein